MISVLFVCLGNICRSPMAEAVLRKFIKDEGLENQISVDSAGTGDWHVGSRPHEGALEKLNENNIDHEGIRARQLQIDDLKAFNYIIAMDSENLGIIHRMAGREKVGYIDRLLDKDVPDPYFTGDFDETYGLIKSGCEDLLDLLKKREEL